MELSLDDNPYQILELQEPYLEISEADIRKAYRKLVLTKHPDKNRDNPNAAAEFNRLQKAYEVLTDPEAKKAFDDLLRAKAAREARWADQDAKRRKMREQLEQREKTSAAEKSAEELAKQRLKHELERLRQQHAEQAAAKRPPEPGPEPSGAPSGAAMEEGLGGVGREDEGALQEQLGRTLKVQWDATVSDYGATELRTIFGRFGPVADVILRDSGASAPSKKRKKGSALVVMADVGAASKAANAVSGDLSNPLLVLRMTGGGATTGPSRDATPAGPSFPSATAGTATASRLPPARAPGGRSLFPSAASTLPRPGGKPLFAAGGAPAAQSTAGSDASAAAPKPGGFSSFTGFTFNSTAATAAGGMSSYRPPTGGGGKPLFPSAAPAPGIQQQAASETAAADGSQQDD